MNKVMVDKKVQFLGSLMLGDLLIAIISLGFVNSEYIRIIRKTVDSGVWEAIFSTFGISLIVWGALYILIDMLRKLEPIPVSRTDIFVLFGISLLFFSPVTALSAVGLTLLGFYYAYTTRSARLRRAMFMLIAMTGTIMWARFAFSFLMPYVLQMDASVISFLMGFHRFDNIVVATDGKTLLQVGAGCSSFLNLTNATLGWGVAVLYSNQKLSLRHILFLVISCVALVMINSIRIGLIGYFPQYFDIIHGDIGYNIANLIETASIFFFSYQAVKK